MPNTLVLAADGLSKGCWLACTGGESGGRQTSCPTHNSKFTARDRHGYKSAPGGFGFRGELRALAVPTDPMGACR